MKARDDPPPQHLVEFAFTIATQVVARWIASGELDPNKIQSKAEFFPYASRLGVSDEDAFEVHAERFPLKAESIQAALRTGDPESALVLLHTLIEGEVNTVLQILLRVRGFSGGKIGEHLQGIDTKTKLDLVLPLLGIKVPIRFRQLTLESQSIRNAAVHYKAKPDRWSQAEEKIGDDDAIYQRATDFFKRNPVAGVLQEISQFHTRCINQCSALQAAHQLMRRMRA